MIPQSFHAVNFVHFNESVSYMYKTCPRDCRTQLRKILIGSININNDVWCIIFLSLKMNLIKISFCNKLFVDCKKKIF